MRNLIALTLILSASRLWAVASQVPPNRIAPVANKPAVRIPIPKSQPKASALTPSMIYTASNLRDPFRAASSGGSVVHKAFKLSDFNIHNLTLRGLIIDPPASYALLIDANYGASFFLRGNRIFTARGKPVPGVSGHLDAKRKTIYLKVRDGDVQVLRMGLKKR